jgi:Ca2+-binding RTX toxin-like protein
MLRLIDPRVALAAAAAAGALALTAGNAHAAYTPTLKDRTLVVTGDAASDELALRQSANVRATIELDVGDDGSADFTIARGQFDRIHVRAGDGDDKVRILSSAVPLPPVTVEGEGGADTLLGAGGADTLSGGEGADTLFGAGGADALSGGAGEDTVAGDFGDDTIDLGAGNDLAVWRPGDGSDALAGADGFDRLAFNGSGADEQLRLARSGTGARLTRDVGVVGIDLGAVERVDVELLGGNDTLTVDDVTGTGVQEVRGDLEAVSGGGAPDANTDRVIVAGTEGADFFSLLDSAGTTSVLGPTFIQIQRGDPTRDDLTVKGLGGDDRIEASPASSLKLVEDGGAGSDTLRGSDRADVQIGGDGDDFVDGARGNDLALLGAGNDRFFRDAAAGSDVVEAQTGNDTISFNGSSAAEHFDVSALGTRTLIRRDGAPAVDSSGAETVSLLSFGGADTFTIGNLSGTGVSLVDVSMFDFGVPGGNNDVVVVSGTAGDDEITAASSAGIATVEGLATRVRMTGTEPAGDRLEINGQSGADSIDSTALEAAELRFLSNAGAGDDVVISGTGDDVLSGGDGADVLFAGSGDNVAFGGAGDDVLRGEEGDDVLDGGAGDDILLGNAGDDVLLNGEVVFDD